MSIFSSQSISYEYIKVRWQEPYVSEAVNRRFWGTIPKGIYNGFIINPGPGLREITVGPGSVSGTGGLGTGLVGPGYVSGLYDETTPYSIAIHNNTLGHSSAVVITPGIHQSYVLDATGLDGQRVYAALDVQYAINVQSSAQVKLVSGSELDANPTMLVIGHVDVPANPLIAIQMSHIGYDDPNYPRITPLSTPNKAGLMPASAWYQINAAFSWSDLIFVDRDPNNFFVLRIKPSQKIVANKRIITFVRASISSKFPRNASEQYNGGPANDQLTYVNLQSGLITGAHAAPGNSSIATPSIVGTPNQWQACALSLDINDRIVATYGAAYSSHAAVVADDNHPLVPSGNFQIATVFLSTDSGGSLLQVAATDIMDRRPFLTLSGGGGGGVDVQDEGIATAPGATTMNFTGDLVRATQPSPGTATIKIDLDRHVFTLAGGLVYDNSNEFVLLPE